MKDVDAEAVDRATLRAALGEAAGEVAKNYGVALALLTVGALIGGVLTWFGFQAWIATSAGFWYLTSSYVAAAVGGLAVVVVWTVIKVLKFVGSRPRG